MGALLAVGSSLARGSLLALSLVLLLAGAEVFTNGVEWLGRRLGLSESATGSVLAAVGTALPETTIPILAVLNGREAANEVGVGAILGAPFMLATVAMFLVGASVAYFGDRRRYGSVLRFSRASTRRDLGVFLVGYGLAFGVALLPPSAAVGPVGVRALVAGLLVALYAAYLYRSVRAGDLGDGDAPDDLHLGLLAERVVVGAGGEARDRGADPHSAAVAAQTVLALAFVVGGARLFVTEIQWLSGAVGVPTALVALVVAPIATELPEVFNSVLWIARDKDTLALNNVTGAMAFQGTLPVTLGLLFSDWNVGVRGGAGLLNAVSVALAIAGALLVLTRTRDPRRVEGRPVLGPRPFLVGGLLYVAFVAASVGVVLVGAPG